MSTKYNILFILFLASASILSAQNTITLTVKSIEKQKGVFKVALYNSKESFEENNGENAFLAKQFDVDSTKTQKIVLSNIPEGDYVIKMYQDINQDNELNRSFLGIPKEPYGFSNNPKISFGPPDYEECIFKVTEKTSLSISLK